MVDILVFGAHPDDAEFGMGGTILRLVKAGKSVAICVLTRGEAGTYGTPEIREREARDAAARAGVQLEMLSFRDCRVFDSYKGRARLAAVIRKHAPSTIFAPYPFHTGDHLDYAAHPDHAATGSLARSAARYARFKGLKIEGNPWNARRLIYYLIPHNLKPTIISDVSPVMDDLLEVARCHRTQLALIGGKLLERLKAQRQATGAPYGLEHAEGFWCDEPLPLDWLL